MSTATEYTLRKLQEALEKIDDLQQALSSIAGDQLRVDQVTAADPPFANITLSNLRDRICGLAPEEGNLWGVWDRLNYIKIAIEKLDDLQQALHSIAGDELDVIVESSALPTGAATEAKQDSILTELQEKVETADLNLDGSGNVGVVAPGGDRIFNIEEVVVDQYSQATGNGDTLVESAVVPAGKIWVITNVAVFHSDGADTRAVSVYVKHDGDLRLIDKVFFLNAWVPYLWSGHTYLDAGDSMAARAYGLATGNTVYLVICGYQMDAA